MWLALKNITVLVKQHFRHCSGNQLSVYNFFLIVQHLLVVAKILDSVVILRIAWKLAEPFVYVNIHVCWLSRFFETLCFEQTNVLFKYLQIFTNFFQPCMSNILPNLTKRLYESHLVGALFSRGFFGLFRIGKITLTFQTLLRKYWIFFSDTHIDLYRIQFF